jgi:hypothetical protein
VASFAAGRASRRLAFRLMGSTPTWVPITVGLIGLLGVIATQLIANRRATTERDAADAREQRRWDHERELRQAAHDREDKFRMYQQRQEAYARLVLELRRWWDVLGEMRAHRVTGNPQPTREQEEASHAAEKGTEEASALAMLLGPPAIRGCYRTLWAHLVMVERAAFWPDTTEAEINQEYDNAFPHYTRMLDYLRIDLGIDPEYSINREKFNKHNRSLDDPNH